MKKFFVPSLVHLNTLLRQDIYNCSPYLYGVCIVMKHKVENDKNHILRMYRNQNFWYDESSCQFIGALDYTIQPESIKIEYININDGGNICYYENKLNQEESNELMDALVDHVKNQVIKKNKSKILLDVHNNLYMYKKYFEKHNFRLTGYKSYDNPYWLETELIIPSLDNKT